MKILAILTVLCLLGCDNGRKEAYVRADGKDGKDAVAGCNNYAKPGSLITTINKSEAFDTGSGVKVTLIGGSSSVGNYYGGGSGNKSMVGVTSFDGLSLNAFHSLSITAQYLIGNYAYANVSIDLNGDNSSPEDRIILTMIPSSLTFDVTPTTKIVLDTDAVWLVSSYGTVNPATIPLNSHTSGLPGLSLAALKAAYPNATIGKSGMIYDGGYSRICPTASVNLNIGDSGYTTYMTIKVIDMSVNGQKVSF